MDALFRLADSMSCKGQLLVGGFDAVRNLCRENQFDVDSLWFRRFDFHGNHLIGMIGEILSRIINAVACESVATDGVVKI